jgi:hypothetical protein
MTDNADFPDAADLLTDLKARQKAYSDALALSKIGSRADIQDKKDRKAELITSLKATADYVDYMSGGDRAIILGSGFPVTKETRTPAVIEAPTGLTVTYGNLPGVLQVSVKKVRGVRSLVFEYTLAETIDANTAWSTSSCTDSKCSITDLPSGKKVWLRVGAVGPRRQKFYTPPIQKMVV